MTFDDRHLLRHLFTAVAVKVLALSILWWVFFHEHHAPPTLEESAANTSDHILSTPSRQGEPL